ncbi:hypothetical protein AVEN_242194-1 [Araneus ventricosus]|uniref:Uncharacterized protein n=1 Tax=Araneus ventricosus TaxID=182803 RepID=A0A4Y2QZC4_ARAVE|nr:hypothetical protein AVEN_242194-1 [Araneus ventricosus]
MLKGQQGKNSPKDRTVERPSSVRDNRTKLPTNRTFGRPRSCAGDKGDRLPDRTFGRPKLCPGTAGTDCKTIWASQACVWGQQDRLQKKQDIWASQKHSLGDNRTGYKDRSVGVPEACLGTDRQELPIKQDIWRDVLRDNGRELPDRTVGVQAVPRGENRDRPPTNRTFGRPSCAGQVGTKRQVQTGRPKLCPGTTGRSYQQLGTFGRPKAVLRDNGTELPTNRTFGRPSCA